MAIETRIYPGKIIFEKWEVQKFIGSGSGGKTAVFSMMREHGDWQEASALKVINILEEIGKKDLLAEIYQQEYDAEREDLCKQAEQELHLMSRLKGNSYIVEYYDFAFVDYQEENVFGTDLLIRMELLKSVHDERKEKGEYNQTEVLHIGKDIAKGLSICHKEGIIHRDIKPANIFVTALGDYKLGDFGIARMVDAGQKASTKMGTRAYAAPEQFMSYGENYDKRVDLYSLGLTLYELSNCNRLPFASSAYVREGEIQLRIMGKELPVPENASRALANVILKACAFRAEDRFASAEEMYDALLAAEIGVSGEAEKGKDTKTSEGVRKNQDRPWLFPAICGVLILMILTLAPSWIYKSIQESKKQKSVTSSDAVPVPEEETVVEQSEAGDLAEAGKSQGIGNSQEPDGSFSPAKIEKLTTEEYAAIFGKAAYVAATLDNVAVIAENGDLYVWGNNKFGQVGCGNTKTQTRPVKILENVAHVEIGSSNVAALTNDGEFYIWGENYGAQIGDGSRNQKNSPVMIARNVKQMSLGNSSAGILLENGDLYTWGNPDENGFGVTQSSPALLASNIESFDLGWMFGGALTKDGELYMWGDNQSGEVGVGDTEPHLTPVKIMDNVAQIHLGFFTASAITEQGELYMWGDNALSQVGAGDGRDISEVREPICILTNVRDVFCSKEYNSGHGGAAVTLDGELYMWGDNDNCQLGEKEDSRIYEPKRISSIFYEKIQTVVLGRRHTAAITEDRKLYLCGSNGNNQINDSALWRVTGFEPVAENIVSVAVGWDVTYAVDGDGSFYCWGK